MSKIRVLPDQLINQIAAGEVVERPASVAKELVENAIDAGALRLHVDVEGGGRRLLRVADTGSGMTRDDALLAFERHATSKINTASDLSAISTLGFRGEALASIASVARVELVTNISDAGAGTRVLIEGGRIRDVKDAAHPVGTTITVRDLFFNVPARRKFLRSEATESFHLTGMVTHYALAHPEIAFTLTNNGRETLRAASAQSLRERAYQIFGAAFLENLLEVAGGLDPVARVHGFVSSPRERRTSRDAQYLFINGRYVRDPVLARALSEGYRTVLPHGSYPAALLFLDVPLEEVDVNVHPAKTEVRFRRASAVADCVREAVRKSLMSAGYVRAGLREETGPDPYRGGVRQDEAIENKDEAVEDSARTALSPEQFEKALKDERVEADENRAIRPDAAGKPLKPVPSPSQTRIEFKVAPTDETNEPGRELNTAQADARVEWDAAAQERGAREAARNEGQDFYAEASPSVERSGHGFEPQLEAGERYRDASHVGKDFGPQEGAAEGVLPQLASVAGLVREVPLEAVTTNIRPVGQLAGGFIIATDDEGLLLIDQHVAHERILFDKYLRREEGRAAESQNLLMPETFDLTPAQAASFDSVADELEDCGFGLMRLSGRTVAVRAVPADLPAGEARGLLAELLDTISSERRRGTRNILRDRIAAALACRAAVKSSTPLAAEKMRWLVDRLLLTSSPTTCPHGRPVILRLATRDIEKSFHRS